MYECMCQYMYECMCQRLQVLIANCSDGLTKREARCKKIGGHFLLFRNKMISKKNSSLQRRRRYGATTKKQRNILLREGHFLTFFKGRSDASLAPY